MNSLNHYTYGSIVEWMYRDMCGLNPSSGDDQVTGFRHAKIAPRPDIALQWARARNLTAAGLYESGWRIDGKGHLFFELTIPFNARARVILPYARVGEILINGQRSAAGVQRGDDLELELEAGQYQVDYQPSKDYRMTYSTRTPVVQLLRNDKVKELLTSMIPALAQVNDAMLAAAGDASLRDLAATPYLPLNERYLNQIDEALKEIAGI
jgi:alpha-L-rhamnosidase